MSRLKAGWKDKRVDTHASYDCLNETQVCSGRPHEAKVAVRYAKLSSIATDAVYVLLIQLRSGTTTVQGNGITLSPTDRVALDDLHQRLDTLTPQIGAFFMEMAGHWETLMLRVKAVNGDSFACETFASLFKTCADPAGRVERIGELYRSITSLFADTRELWNSIRTAHGLDNAKRHWVWKAFAWIWWLLRFFNRLRVHYGENDAEAAVWAEPDLDKVGKVPSGTDYHDYPMLEFPPSLRWSSCRKNEATQFIEDMQSVERLCRYFTNARGIDLQLGPSAAREMWAGHFLVLKTKSEMLQHKCCLRGQPV